MNIRKTLVFFSCLVLFSQFVFAQKNFSVDPLTGTGSAVIPIYTISHGQVSVPVNLVYSASGVRPKDVEGTAGMGWNIQAGGQISRTVQGLPDDVTQDNNTTPHTMFGWMNPLDTGANKINAFTITNNGSTCSNETTDISYITTNFPYRDDTEPDQFYVSAPGLSCELIYRRDSAKFVPVVYQDLKISYTVVGGTGANKNSIASFTITNDKGIKYIFSTTESITQRSVGSPTYFKTKFLQYQDGITYNNVWDLTSIQDANGNGIGITYNSVPQTSGADSVALYVGSSSSYTLQYKMSNIVNSQRIASIATTSLNSSETRMSFVWETPMPGTGQTLIDTIKVAGNNFVFNYGTSTYTPKNYVRNFLRNMGVIACSSPINYQFAYAGETGTGSSYTTVLPDSSSVQRDYWGYYSTRITKTSLKPKLWMAGLVVNIPPYAIYESNTGAIDTYPYYTTDTSASIRQADSLNVMAGSLNKIIFPEGGSTNIIYEPNDYLDAYSGNVVKGGGIRVREIIDSAGNGSTSTIIHNYSYINPVTGLSSGKPVSLPCFGFTIPYSGSFTGNYLWNACSAISAYDLSTEDHSIMYQYSKVSQTGAGYTQYQYYLPAMNFDVSATPACSGCTTTEWRPTTDYAGRTNCSVTNYGPITNHTQNYPFIPNPNYDFERGLPLQVISYSNDPTPKEVSETDYVYQRSYTPTSMYAVKWEDNPSGSLLIKSYGKYQIFFTTSELTDTVKTKVFDSNGSGTSQITTAIYTYGSANHKLLTQQKMVNSDNSIHTTNISYVKDYAANSNTNANINALYQLKLLNINAPVESYSQVTRGGTTLTTAASLTLFNGFTVGTTTHYLPAIQYKMIKADGEGFTPFSINTGTSTIALDTGYFKVANYDVYDNTGFPLTVDDTHHNYQTTIFDHFSGKASAVFSNTQYGEIGFSDFDSDVNYPTPPSYNFTFGGTGGITPTGSHAGYAFGLATTRTLTKTVNKNAIASNYIFSIWINAPSGTNTLTISLNGGSAVSYPYTGNGTWQYHEWKLSVTSMPSSFSITVGTLQNISIDDVLFYPDVAEVATATYDQTGHFKLDATNTNGVSTYFVNDQWGRVLYALDQDKNIVQKNTYVTVADETDFTPYITQGAPVVNTPIAFGLQDTTPGACALTVGTVTWTFGDGSSPVHTTLTTSPSHTYTVFGTYTVTAVIYSPLYGTKTATTSVVIPPSNITLSFTNSLPMGNGNMTTLTFSQGGVTKYSFTPSTISGATIKQGVYTIVETISNPTNSTAYSAPLTADCWYGCSNYTSSSTLTFTYTGADLSTCSTMSVSLYTGHCSGPP